MKFSCTWLWWHSQRPTRVIKLQRTIYTRANTHTLISACNGLAVWRVHRIFLRIHNSQFAIKAISQKKVLQKILLHTLKIQHFRVTLSLSINWPNYTYNRFSEFLFAYFSFASSYDNNFAILSIKRIKRSIALPF